MPDPDFDRRHAAALAEMAAAGLPARQAQPLGARLLAKAGFRMTPAPYRSFFANTVSMGLFFGLFWGAGMYVWVWQDRNMPVMVGVGVAAAAGLMFGVAMAGFAVWQRKRLRLSRWQDL